MDEVEDPVRGEVPTARHLQQAELRTRLRRLLDNLLGQEQSCGLASQLSMTARRENDSSLQIKKIFDLDEVLGDVDELEVLGEKPADQRDAQAFLGRKRKPALFDGGVLITFDCLDDFSQRSRLVLQRPHQEAAFLFFDPGGDATE